MFMNKYVLLGVGLLGIIGAGIVYRIFFLPESARPVDTGIVKEITVRIPKNSWTFEPERIEVTRGDTLKLTFINEDDYDHGVGIDAYGVSQRIPAKATLEVPPFVVTKAGYFQFYCSVSCSEGVAESGKYRGEKRGHFDQIGLIVVRELDGSLPGAAKEPEKPKDPPALLSAKAALAKELGIHIDEVTYVDMTLKDWPDGCLGIAGGDEMCTQAIVPGFEITLKAKDAEYLYRTDMEGKNVRKASPAMAQ